MTNLNLFTLLTFDDFSHYMAGLIEGDGTIYVPREEYSIKGKKNYPSIQIAFHIKEIPLAMQIIKKLGAGSVAEKKGTQSIVLTVNSKEGLKILVGMINGKMRTPKIKRLYALIE